MTIDYNETPNATDTMCTDSTAKARTCIDKLRLSKHPLLRACLAEFVGTWILLIFGAGVLAQVSLGDEGRFAHGGFMSISLGWGMAVTFGVFFAGAGGSGIINPAITLAFAAIGRLPFHRVPLYMLSQLAGAFFGALTVFGVYYEKIHEKANLSDNNTLLVETTGGIFVTNPGISTLGCFIDQVVGTALLAAGALTITDFKGWEMPKYLHPLYLGLLVYTIVGAFGINAGAALNPARDLGPRIMIAICGWGVSAFTSGNYYFWVPIIGPFVGALLGAVLYEATIGIHLDVKKEISPSPPQTPKASAGGREKDAKSKLHLLE